MSMLAQIAASGGGVGPAYIEDVFSTYLYTGDGATQTIVNGIDLAGKGGLTWFKSRASVSNHFLFNSVRGTNKYLRSQLSSAEATSTSDWISSFNSNGFSLGSNAFLNTLSESMVSWTFRKQPKFFDVVTYTGTGTAQNITHNLGSVPGCVIVKCASTTGVWQVYHRELTSAANTIQLNFTNAESSAPAVWNSTAPTSTIFTVGTDASVNASGETYVAYLYAHNAGGFGLSGSENVVSCGGFVTNGSGAAKVELGYEPQFILFKLKNGGDNWIIFDNMRGWANTGTLGSAEYLYPNTSGAAGPNTALGFPFATGFEVANQTASGSYIYIAIRRGPMKVPTLGTTVYNGITRTGTGAVAQVTGVGFPPDLVASGFRNFGGPPTFFDKLRGPLQYLTSSATNAEATRAGTLTSFDQNGFSLGADAFNLINFNTGTFVDWNFRRAPSFFDEVCYTGDGTLTPRNHNLTVAPQLVITKSRAATSSWYVAQYLSAPTTYGLLNTTDAFADAGSSYPVTATTFVSLLASSAAEVTYLFATCAGVSKVGSYTGTGTTQAINCGFTAGARFVLIKRTDAAGDWYVWDSARGIVAGNDPYLLLNSTAAEVTSTDYVDTSATGFELTSTAPAAINASGGSYIFLAVA